MGVDLLWHVDGDIKLDCSLHADGGHEVGWLPTYINGKLHISLTATNNWWTKTHGRNYSSAGLGGSPLWSSWLILLSVLGPANRRLLTEGSAVRMLAGVKRNHH